MSLSLSGFRLTQKLFKLMQCDGEAECEAESGRYPEIFRHNGSKPVKWGREAVSNSCAAVVGLQNFWRFWLLFYFTNAMTQNPWAICPC